MTQEKEEEEEKEEGGGEEEEEEKGKIRQTTLIFSKSAQLYSHHSSPLKRLCLSKIDLFCPIIIYPSSYSLLQETSSSYSDFIVT